jgi:hypothetical protein
VFFSIKDLQCNMPGHNEQISGLILFLLRKSWLLIWIEKLQKVRSFFDKSDKNMDVDFFLPFSWFAAEIAAPWQHWRALCLTWGHRWKRLQMGKVIVVFILDKFLSALLRLESKLIVAAVGTPVWLREFSGFVTYELGKYVTNTHWRPYMPQQLV